MVEPVWLDLETRSSCDLRARGGRAYAADPSTRILTAAWIDGEAEHVWMPGAGEVPEAYRKLHLPDATVHTGPTIPGALPLDRTWACHNCDTFDSHVWRGRGLPEPKAWVDTYPLALSLGLPGGLDKIGKLLWGEGKYESGKKLMLKASKCAGVDDCDPANVPVGQQVLIAAYNCQDVRLGKALWGVIQREYRSTPEEAEVLAAHKAINDRGVRVDRGLLYALIDLDSHARADSVRRIAEATGGRLKDQHDLQSRTTMFAWLKFMGVDPGKSLAKTIVDKWIGENRGSDDDSDDDSDALDDGPPPRDLKTIVAVLEMRSAALRITGGKLKAALEVLGDDDRVRDLHVFHAGHTGRWAARRIQTHNLPVPKKNLPPPKKNVDVWKLIDLFETTGKLDLEAVREQCDPNDAASGLLRSLFLPDPGYLLADADLAQIEARLLAWVAGEKWLMDLYWADGDPYIKMAEAVAGPKEKWPNPNGLPYKKHDYRQDLGKVPELAAGYQMGATKLALYAAQMGVNLRDYDTTEEECITAYRMTHPAIAGTVAGEYNGKPYFRGGLWDRLNAAALAACAAGGPVRVGPVSFHREGANLIMFLPSGRRFVYRNAVVEDREYFGRKGKAVVYVHPRYGRKTMYGGAWAENLIQAMGRDTIAYCIAACEREGLGTNLHVHDQGASSLRESDFPTFMRCMSTPPPWLPNFPLVAEGSMTARWAKTPPKGTEEQTWRNGERHK